MQVEQPTATQATLVEMPTPTAVLTGGDFAMEDGK